jgi:hypothetical protein
MDLRDQLDQANIRQSNDEIEGQRVRVQYDELIKYSSTVESELRTLLEDASRNESTLREQLNEIQARQDETDEEHLRRMDEVKLHYDEVYSTEMKQMQQDLGRIRDAFQRSELLLQQSRIKISELEDASKHQQVLLSSQQNRESEGDYSALKAQKLQLEQEALSLRSESSVKLLEVNDLKCQLEAVRLERNHLSEKLAATIQQQLHDNAQR